MTGQSGVLHIHLIKQPVLLYITAFPLGDQENRQGWEEMILTPNHLLCEMNKALNTRQIIAIHLSFIIFNKWTVTPRLFSFLWSETEIGHLIRMQSQWLVSSLSGLMFCSQSVSMYL